MASINITADNLPKDSGNRFMVAPYDPALSAFNLLYAFPVSGAFGGLAIGHMTNQIADTMTATGGLSSGVDLGGYPIRGLLVPPMGSGCEIYFQFSASGQGWVALSTDRAALMSATGGASLQYAMSPTAIGGHSSPYRYVRMTASQGQTATRTFVWAVST